MNRLGEPMTIDQMMQMATEHHRGERLTEAEQLYRAVLQLEPAHADALHQLGMLLAALGDDESAIEMVRQAIATSPADARFYETLGVLLRVTGDFDGAVANLEKAAEMVPEPSATLTNLGILLQTLGRHHEAVDAFSRATQANPRSPQLLSNLACALTDVGDYTGALQNFETVLRLHPDMSVTHWNLGLLLLSLGHFERGWQEFEWRLKVSWLGLKRDFDRPQWRGEDIAGQTLLVFAEGGFGDAFHFSRYLHMLLQRNASIIFECQPEAFTFFQQLSHLFPVIPRGQSLPHFDWQIPLQSLPLVFKTTLQSIPSRVPYLSAPPDAVSSWQQRSLADPGFKVGLAWAGSSTGDPSRSRSLSLFASLAQIPGISFYCLQKGPEASEPPPSGIQFRNSLPLGDFCDTAGLIANLDLVISVDTSIVHLAGALARPVWTLLPIRPDFRWLRDRNDSPWYPTMRLFRQTTHGQWEDVVQKVADELRKLSLAKS